ncbi:TonB-dependent receptor [Luteimonas suaedae]|uniref:TonB-dependent receptor n=1 Tax=Luteimonas suaedae TaxID=2605430 RepID=UPI0011ED6025|nr:TonB-dependent receptor [Luteimonas suaedae]
MPHCRHPLALALHLGLVAAVLPYAVAAQTAPEADASGEIAYLDTMVVTAQKREQQVSEVPIAISAYSGDFLQDYNVREFSDIGNLVPGLVVQEQSPNNPGFVIRGITSDSGEANVEPRVSVFQDGVSISKSRGSIVQPFDLERVEVLRGPQGTLFGRGAQIGAVHLIQNKAFNGTEAGFTVGAGNESATLLTGYANTPLVEDKLYGRVAVYHEKRDGFVDNLSGGDLNGKDTQAIRASFRLDLRETDTLDLILNWQKDTPPGTAFRSGSIPTRTGSLDVLDRTADLNRGEALGLDRTVRGATLLGNFALGPAWSLTTITGWRDFDSAEEFDADGAQIYALEFAEIAEGRQLSQEFRFNYDSGGRFTGFAGASWFHEKGSQRVPFRADERSFITLPAVGLGIPPLLPDGTPNTTVDMLPLAPGVVVPLKPFHEEQYANFGETDAWEFFADGTFAATDRLNLTLGLRGTHEDVTAGYQADYFGVPSYLGLAGLGGSPDPANPTNILFAPTDGRLSRSESFSSLVGRAVADYRIDDDHNGYVSVSRGRRPNVINVDAFSSEVIDDEIVWSYELGLKGAFADGHLLYDLAVFRYDYSNFQTTVRDDDTLLYVPANGGNATANGAELSLLWRASRNLSAFLNYGYVDATFDDTDDDGNPQELAGNRFRLTSEHSASAGLDAGFDLDNGARLYLRPSWNWRSQAYFEDDNTPGIEQGGYALYNLRAGVQFGDGRWDVSVYGSNLADKDYLIDAGNTGRLFGTPTFIQGAPRTYGMTLSGRF